MPPGVPVCGRVLFDGGVQSSVLYCGYQTNDSSKNWVSTEDNIIRTHDTHKTYHA